MLPPSFNTNDTKGPIPAFFRKRRCLFLTTSTFAITFYLCLGNRIGGSHLATNKLGLQDQTWDHIELDASALTYPPEDPHYLLFEPPSHVLRSKDSTVTKNEVALPEGRLLLPDVCLDDHFSKGAPCFTGSETPLDVVWTWVNGSDRLLMESMSRTVRTTNPKLPAASRPDTGLYRCEFFF